jgi:hypothetical protein
MDHIAEQFASLQREQERLNALKRAENRRVKLLQKGERLAAELSVWKQTSPMKKTPSGKDGGIGRKLAEFRRQMHKEGADNPIFQQISKNITDVLETDDWLKSTAPKPCLPKTMVDDIDMMVAVFRRWKEQYEQPEGLIPLPNNTVTLTDEECQRFGCDSPTIDIGRWLFDCCAVQSRFEKLTPLTCGHGFHRACISRWLEDSSVCPYCRQPIMSYHDINIEDCTIYLTHYDGMVTSGLRRHSLNRMLSKDVDVHMDIESQSSTIHVYININLFEGKPSVSAEITCIRTGDLNIEIPMDLCSGTLCLESICEETTIYNLESSSTNQKLLFKELMQYWMYGCA